MPNPLILELKGLCLKAVRRIKELESQQVEIANINLGLNKLIEEMEGNMGFENFVGVAEKWLENYPPDIFDGSSGDAGPTFIVALRKAILELDKQHHTFYRSGG